MNLIATLQHWFDYKAENITILSTPKKKKIIILSSTFPRWCGDKEPPFVYELARRIGERYQILVLAPHFPGAFDRETLSDIDIVRFRYSLPCLEKLSYGGGILSNIKRYPLMIFQVPLFLLSQWVYLIKLIRDSNPALIHAHWVIPQGIVAVLACLFFQNPPVILCTIHGGDLFGLRQKFAVFLRKFVYQRAKGLTVVSSAMKCLVIHEGGLNEYTKIIPMGVDLRRQFYPLQTYRTTNEILFVGRLVEKKGLIYLLKAMPKILERFPQTQLTVIGDGPELNKCKHLVSHINIASHVKFIGAIANEKLPDYYRRSGIVVFPSIIDVKGDQEGFGLVLVEAMGCGCAVVTTNLKAMQDIVTDGVNGMVVDEKSSDQIADAVNKLLTNSNDIARLQQCARDSVLERFDWQIITEKYCDMIDSLLNQ